MGPMEGTGFTGWLHQWTFPQPFRIRPVRAGRYLRALAQAVLRATEAARAGRQQAEECRAELATECFARERAQAELGECRRESTRRDPVGAVLDAKFLVAIGNQHFRLRRNLAQLAQHSQDTDAPPPVRRIARALGELELVFEEYGVECLDLTGQTYDIGRRDFEQIAAAEVVLGLSRETITLCERPAIVVAGKLIQTARGIVSRPP